MSQNPRKQVGGPKVEEGFPLWRSQTSRRNRLLEFKAGKMFVRENMVHPDTRKGLVYLYQDDEGVMHFCWMDRSRGVVEEDLMTMPADCSYKRVEKCTTGRVYMLKMKSSSRVMFYWMQEPSAANDLHICNRVNSLLNFPPPRIVFPEQIFSNELQFILNQLNSQQLQALYNGDEIVRVDLRNQPAEAENSSGPQQPSAAAPPPPDPFVNLGEVVNEVSVKTISKTPSLMKRIEGKLPPVQGDEKMNLDETIKSIPFKHAIEDFSLSLRQGTSGQILRDLDVNRSAVAAAEKGDVDSFIKALQGTPSIGSPANGGSPPGPGNSGSPENRPKDPSQANNGKDSEGGRKERTKQEEPKSNVKHTNGGTRKRTYDTMSGGVIQVHSGQQTEPIRITALVQSKGPEMKTARKYAPSKVYNTLDGESSLEKGQTTDPVQIEEYISCGEYNWNNEQQASGSSQTSGLIQRNVQHMKQEATIVNIKDGLEPVVPTISNRVNKVGNEINMTTKDITESTIATDELPSIWVRTDESKPSNITRDGGGIVLMNDYQKELNAASRKRKRTFKETEETKEGGKEAGTKAIKLENGDKIVVAQIRNDGAEGNIRGVTKVEGEQQTEPVRIKSAHSSGAERKITAKRETARGPRTEGSTERSQNTDPVLIEEKQKKQSKPRDQKPPGQQ